MTPVKPSHGRRLILKKDGDQVIGINRLGFPTAVPESIVQSAKRYMVSFILDGEAVGDQFHAFDLVIIGQEDMKPLRYAVRYFRMWDMLFSFFHPHIQCVDSHFRPNKAGVFSELKRAGKEGVVFKHHDSPYTPGRPNAGGQHLKYKFVQIASFIVAKVNDKRSVSLILFDGEKVRPAGNVTIPANHDIPSPETVVEWRYLYGFKESGSIYQPVFLGARQDIRIMQPISLPIAELKSALSGLGKVIHSKAALHVLHCVKVERTSDGWIALTGADLDAS